MKNVEILKGKASNIRLKAALLFLISICNLTRNTLLAGLFLLLLMSFTAGCAEVGTKSPGTDQPDATTINGEEGTIMDNKIEKNDFTIPPIDQDIPGHLETATLAMG